MNLSLLGGRLCWGKQDVNVHCQKGERNRACRLYLPKVSDDSNARIYGFNCRVPDCCLATVRLTRSGVNGFGQWEVWPLRITMLCLASFLFSPAPRRQTPEPVPPFRSESLPHDGYRPEMVIPCRVSAEHPEQSKAPARPS
jgi:hypothetical protein